jgi:DNA-binding GntR family transcriptional regulator
MPLQEQTVIPDRRPTHELVADSLRYAILNGELALGERLAQDEIAIFFNVSRQPVREALLKLQAEGLVVSTHHKGYAVAKLSLDEVEDIFAIRIFVERLAIRRAVPRLTPQHLQRLEAILEQQEHFGGDRRQRYEYNQAFHTTIYEAAERSYMTSLIGNLRNIVEPYCRIYMANEGRADASLREHHEIFDACVKGDARRSEEVVESHLRTILGLLVPHLPITAQENSDGNDGKVGPVIERLYSNAIKHSHD